jgi:hypothetical protein
MMPDSLSQKVDDGKHAMILKFMDDGWAMPLTDMEAPSQMPYFVGGEAFKRMEQKQGVTLTPDMLLCGILTTWFEPEKYIMPGGREALRTFLIIVLNDLRLKMEIDTLEHLIIREARQVFADHGSLPSVRMLRAGCDILPDSTLIRSDLIMLTWHILEHAPNVDRANAMEMIVSAFSGMDSEVLQDDLVEIIDYVYMVSLAFLKQHEECARFYWRTASKRVRHPILKKRMNELSEDRLEDFERYRIWDKVVA